MAGCFGNSPYDRYVENQLNRYLDECDKGEAMSNLVEDMMHSATHDAALFRTYDDDFEVIDRDQIMRCLANLDGAVKDFNRIFLDAENMDYYNLRHIEAIFTALSIMQKNLQKAVESKAEKVLEIKAE